MSNVSFPDIGLKPRQAQAAARRAEQGGKSPAEYLRSLVERDLLVGGSFDEVLRPLRRAFAKGGVGEDELDKRVATARRDIHARTRRKGGK